MKMYLNEKDLSALCNYSFGIHAGVLAGLPEFYIKKANKQNREFTRKVNEISKVRNYMTVFIDNLRLYKQKKQFVKISDTKKTFYENLSECAFVLCPAGNGLDTHKLWETIILKRVPVVPDTRFFRELLKNYAVLYIKDMTKISEQILMDNYRLVEMAQKQDIDSLYTHKFYTKKVAEALEENNIA